MTILLAARLLPLEEVYQLESIWATAAGEVLQAPELVLALELAGEQQASQNALEV
jgi:hypothetical protein